MKPSLTACLKGLTKEVRKPIADFYDCDPEPGVLSDAILRCLREDGFAGRLHSWEQTAMEWLCFRWGDRHLSEEGELPKSISLTPSRFRTALVLLRRKGLVFRLRRHPSGWAFWCPREVRRAFLSSRTPFSAVPLREEGLEDATPGCRGIWDPLFHFAVLLEREGMPLTRERRVPRREERKLEAELDLEEDLLTHSRWGKGTEAPTVRLVSDFLYSLGILKVETEQWTVRLDVLGQWLRKPWTQRITELFRLTEDFLLEDCPAWDGFWWWMEQQGSGWVSLRETCLGWLSETGGARRLPAFLKEVEERWFRPLAAVGWVETREGTEGGFWRWTPWLSAEEIPVMKGYVKPDFEVLLPPFLPLTHRFLLAQFADFMGGEILLSHVITPASVRRGAERGLSADRMLDTLREISGDIPVPDAVADSIRRWAGGSRPFLRKGWVLQFPEGAKRDFSEKEGLELGLEILSEGIFFVPADRVDSLRKRLTEGGCPLLEPEQTSWWNTLWDGSPLQKKEEGAAAVENRLPSQEEAVPGFNRLPKVWTSGLRPYHPTTLRTLLQRAVEMELDLLFSTDDRPPARFTPDKMVQMEGYWQVTGQDAAGRQRRYTLEDFGKVQILPPWQGLQ